MTGIRRLRTVALVKQVPGLDDHGDIGPDGRLVRGSTGELNPWCRRALAQAVRLGGHSTAISMGPPAARDVLREALACGVDTAIHLSDPALAGSDCLVTARALAEVVRRLDGGADLVLVGRSSVDGGTAAVGPMLAELLGLPFVGAALDMSVESGPLLTTVLQADGATATARVRLPAVVAVAERSCAPAKATEDTWPDGSAISTVDTSVLPPGRWGAEASPTWVSAVRPEPAERRAGLLTDEPRKWVAWVLDELLRPTRMPPRAEPADRPVPVAGPDRRVLVVTEGADAAAVHVLLDRARSLTGGQVVLVTPTPLPEALWGLADRVVLLDRTEPRPVAAAIDGWLRRTGLPWAVLGAAAWWDREVLSRLAVRLGTGLASDLTAVEVTEEQRLLGLKPAGRNGLAEIRCRPSTQVATLRTGCFPESAATAVATRPDVERLACGVDPDVVRSVQVTEVDRGAVEHADVVIGVGQGVPPREYPALDRLRVALGAEFGATRKVTDRGWLPHSRQIGVTARSVAPRVYLAIGLSGSRNHLAGVRRAGVIAAVNSDPDAAVFGACDIGLVGDWHEAVALLTEEVRRAGGRRVPNGIRP